MIKGFKCIISENNVSFEECLKCSLTCQNKCQFDYPVLKGIAEQVAEERNFISITSLLGCLRGAYFLRTNEVYVSPEDLYYSFRGIMIHKIVEDNPHPDSITEERFYRTLYGLKISGRPDCIIPSKGILKDYKSCKAVPRYDRCYKNHIEQLNGYKWLIEPKYEIKKLEVCYLDMMGEKRCEAPIWDSKRTKSFLTERILVLNDAFKNNKVPPVPEEWPNFWQCNKYCPVVELCSKVYREELKNEIRKEMQNG